MLLGMLRNRNGNWHQYMMTISVMTVEKKERGLKLRYKNQLIQNQIEGKALHENIIKETHYEGHSKSGRCVRMWSEDLEEKAKIQSAISNLRLVRVTTIKEYI